MRLIEEVTTPSAAALAAVQAARTAEQQRTLTQPLQGGGVDDPAWQPASADVPEPVGLTASEVQQMDQLRDKYGKYQRERDGGAPMHVSTIYTHSAVRRHHRARRKNTILFLFTTTILPPQLCFFFFFCLSAAPPHT